MTKLLPTVKPDLAPLDELAPYLDRIWDSRMVSNCGPLHEEFESRVAAYLGVEYVTLVSNATLGSIIALKALNLSGEVITTPFTFVATGNAIIWAGLTPVFVDISPKDFNIDPEQIRLAIGAKTSAIMPVHTFGRVCRVDEIQSLASSHELATVYDAAHAFGVKSHGESVLDYGDMSVISFHGTKAFNTFEGGAIVAKDAPTKAALDALRDNGYDRSGELVSIGINAKMSEFNAALGLVHLDRFPKTLKERAYLHENYRDLLSEISGLSMIEYDESETPNYNYFPIIVGEDYGLSRDALCTALQSQGIISRRYFFPLLNDFSTFTQTNSRSAATPQAKRISNSILCIPMFTGMTDADQQRVSGALKSYAG